jgi:multidrug resistance efflux pump
MPIFAFVMMLLILVLTSNTAAAQTNDGDPVASAPGRIEAVRGITPLGAAVTAVVKDVLVGEGARVHPGQELVRFDCQPVENEVTARSADLAAAEAAFTRTRNGARPEEIAIAEANLRLSQARAQEAEHTYQRTMALREGVTTTRAQIELARRDARVSAAQVEDARARLNLLRAGSRQEDIEEARARYNSAARWLQEARARLDQCTVRAPSEGVVLRTLVAPGQFISTAVPTPLLQLIDDRHLRIRAEVEEGDVHKLCAGQRATVSADSFPGTSYAAQIERISPEVEQEERLQRTSAEKSVRDTRQVLLAFDASEPQWPVGLHVTVQFRGACRH